MQKMGWSEGKGLCSLVGLAPWSKDSGRQRGYRTRLMRRALFMAALPVIRRPGELRQFYQGCVKGAGPARWLW